MIDNPENGQIPDVRVSEADPVSDVQTATAVAEPRAQITQPAPSSPGLSSRALTPTTEAGPTAEAAGDQSGAIAEPLAATTEPLSERDFSSELTKFRQSFEEVQAEFIGEPRAAVEKAETLIDGLMNGLHDQLQRIHGNLKTETDTEELRVAMLSYRELFDSLGGNRPA